MIDFRALTVHRPVQPPLLSQFAGCSLNEKQALCSNFLAVLRCLKSREFRGLNVWHSCTPLLWHLNGRRRVLHPAVGNSECLGNERNFGVHKPNGRHTAAYNNENGHFNGSSNNENGFGPLAEGADPFVLSVATDSFATKLQDDFVEVQVLYLLYLAFGTCSVFRKFCKYKDLHAVAAYSYKSMQPHHIMHRFHLSFY